MCIDLFVYPILWAAFCWFSRDIKGPWIAAAWIILIAIQISTEIIGYWAANI